MNKKIAILVLIIITLALLAGTVLLDEWMNSGNRIPDLLEKDTPGVVISDQNEELLPDQTAIDVTGPINIDEANIVDEIPDGMDLPGVSLEQSVVYIPVVLLNYPPPEGYRSEIGQMVGAVSMTRFENTIRDLVYNFSPRTTDQYQIFTDLQICNQGGARFEQSNLQRVLDAIQEKFKDTGYTVSTEKIPELLTEYNIIAEKPASVNNSSAEVIEIAAQIDSSANTPGASRNAAGVAGVLEMAEVLREFPNSHPWRFIIFVEIGEQKIGSQLHVQYLTGKPVKTALILDGIGWSEIEPESMNCIGVNPDLPYTQEVARIFNSVRQSYDIDIGWRECSIPAGFSSETRYWEAGIPAVLSVGGLPYKNPTLDKCSDNMANLSLVNGFLTIKQNIAVLLTLDNEP